jgi:putative phosphoesterase
MRIVIFSDVHGNYLAFDSFLKIIEKESYDKVICLGDVFGYLSDGRLILDEIIRRKFDFIIGNHEAMLIGRLPFDLRKDAVYKLMDDKINLTNFQKDFLCYSNDNLELFVDENKLLFVHGSPMDRLCGYLYEDSNFSVLDDLDYDMIFVGHTHRPYIKYLKKAIVVNVGSLGLPRDIGNSSCYTILNTESSEIIQKRFLFDTKGVVLRYGRQVHKSVIECLKRN